MKTALEREIAYLRNMLEYKQRNNFCARVKRLIGWTL